MEDRQVKVYLTRTEDIDVTKEARRQFADWVGADLYLEIGLSSDPENTSVYGISGEYNDEYYIPEFGNLQWADCVTRQVTVAASNRQWDFSGNRGRCPVGDRNPVSQNLFGVCDERC